ncbi:hypothetical protein L0128_12140 [candidate division KSB1 bacterium]|nr:hypothetical protein [candidate division KSB1 bacterium]
MQKGMNTRRLLIFSIILIAVGANCYDPAAERKIDPYLKLKIEQLAARSQLEQPILILFKSSEELNETHLQVLQKKKIQIQANIGNIYTATTTAQGISELAKMRFVLSIEPSKELKRTLETNPE